MRPAARTLTTFSPARGTVMTEYKQLTYEQRCHIEAYMKTGFSQRQIARLVGVHQSTISRELRRNLGLRGYRCDQVQ
jgi:transposase, IS30 family